MFCKLKWSFQFAISEIRSEWLFGLGVALAVCSVLTPTALLWGTKTGMIDKMRSRLLKDPAIRELVGEENTALPIGWFEKMRANPTVSFVIPSVRRISLYGEIHLVDSPGKSIADVAYLPTAKGDPIGGGVDLGDAYKGGPVPCMIAERLAEELGIKQGGRFVISVSRIDNGATVKASFEAVARRILQPHESNTKVIFLPLEAIERIEDYKDGRAVPGFSWNKTLCESLRIYDSFRLSIKGADNKSALADAFRALSETRDVRITGAPEDGNIGVASTGDGIEHSSMLRMARLFAAFELKILLQAEARTRAAGAGGNSTLQDMVLVGDESSWISLKEAEEMEAKQNMASMAGASRTMAIECGANIPSLVRFSLPSPAADLKTYRLPPAMVGVIGAAKRRPVEFTQTTGEFRPLREQYPGFRLYARELEDVKSLRLACAEQGIQVRTKEDRIQGVLYLDSALGKFLAFIVVAGGMGGVGALFTSLYLSIERSRRQFAVLQILGIPRFHVFVSTLLQAILMVLAGGIASFVFFQIGSWLLTAVLTPENNTGGKVCELSMWQWGVLAGASVICAFLATILALGRLRFKDPAVVARSE